MEVKVQHLFNTEIIITFELCQIFFWNFAAMQIFTNNHNLCILKKKENSFSFLDIHVLYCVSTILSFKNVNFYFHYWFSFYQTLSHQFNFLNFDSLLYLSILKHILVFLQQLFLLHSPWLC